MIDPEAARRLSGHENLVQKICALAREEAQARGLSILRIDVRPAWSHEYDEHTGIFIAVEITAVTEGRFSYSDALCERLNQLAEMLPPEERRFLNDEIFLYCPPP
jgi:hypothetical protein